MDIYIDNEKTRYGKRTKDFEKILKSISKSLEKKEKIIKSIYINGTRLHDGIIIDMSYPNVVEVETKSYADLALESLENSKEYIATFFEIRENFKLMVENRENLSEIDIQETNNFLLWFTDLVYLLVQSYTFAFSDLEEVFDTMKEELDILIELIEKKDYIAYINILEYCIVDILEAFRENIDYYCEVILKEEENKKILF